MDILKSHIDSFKTYTPEVRKSTFIMNDRPNDVADLISKLQAKVKEFRIRVREFLRDFDLLRRGSITQTQFRSGLNIAKIPLSDDEFNLLVQEFKIGDNHIDWRRFSDIVDQV